MDVCGCIFCDDVCVVCVDGVCGGGGGGGGVTRGRTDDVDGGGGERENRARG